MAYTEVPTVAVGDLYTADNFNTYLRDNFAAGIPDKFTAHGDIGAGEGADTIGILALGGGASRELTDIMEKNNLKIPKLAEETKEKFKEFLPEVNTIIRNPLDLGGAGTVMDVYYKSITTLAQDPNISTIVFNRVYNYNPDFTKTIVEAKKNIKDKQLVCVALKIMDMVEDYKEKLRFKTALFMNKIPVFESIERAAKALDQMNTYREFLEKHEKPSN